MARRALWIAGGVVLFLVIAVLAIPAMLQGRVAQQLEAALDEAMLADTSFDDVQLGLLGSFPELTLTLRGMAISDVERFPDAVLWQAEEVRLGVNLWSALFADTPVITQVRVVDAALDMRVAADGTSNLDIFPPEESDTPLGPWSARLDHVEVSNLAVAYVDLAEHVDVGIEDLDLSLDGTIGSEGNVLDIDVSAAGTSAHQSDMAWLDGATVAFATGLRSDAAGTLTLEEAVASINALSLAFDGSFTPTDDGTMLDVTLAAPEASLAALLSLLPDIASDGIDDLDADGRISLGGSIDGLLPNEGDALPGFELAVKIEEGRFTVPDRDLTVRRVDLEADLRHPSGPLDELEIDVSTFGLAAKQTQLEGALRMTNPTTDPNLDLTLQGTLGLAEIEVLVPGATSGASGVVELGIEVEGRVSDFVAADASSIEAVGRIHASDVDYDNPALSAVPWQVHDLDLSLAGAGATLDALDISWPSGDTRSALSIQGTFDRFLAYFLDEGGVLSGSVSMAGSHTDLRAWSGADTTTEEDATVVEVPKNLALTATLDFDHLALDSLAFDDLTGTMTIADGVARFDRVRGDVYGGRLELDGSYSADGTAEVDVSMRTIRVELGALVSEFETLRRIAPVMNGATGTLDSTLAIDAQLLPDGTPILSTLSSTGSLRTVGLALSPDVLKGAATKLGRDDAGTLDLGKSKIAFEIAGGRLDLRPFSLSLGKWKATGSGQAQLLNETLDMAFVTPVKARALRDTPFLTSLGVDVPSTLDVELRVSGSYAAPTLSIKAPNLGSAIDDRVDEVVDDLTAAAREAAQKRGEALVAEARSQAEAIENEAAKAATELRELAQSKGERLIEEAGNHLVKRALARESARIANRQADKAASKIEDVASERATRLVAEAEAQRDQWVEEAGP